MTKEQALTLLHEIKDMSLPWNDEHYEALGMAIEMIENSKRPTNLDIYLCDSEDDTCLCLYENTYEDYIKATNYEISYLAWLQQPYESPKYKLSRFEYDLLECCNFAHTYCMSDFWLFEKMHKKGYLKDIPSDVLIKDILDNCEVIDE